MEDYWWLPNTMYVYIFPYSTKRSEKQGEADSDNNRQQILDDDMEDIEPVVYKLKEGRRKGSKKKKGQKRWKNRRFIFSIVICLLCCITFLMDAQKLWTIDIVHRLCKKSLGRFLFCLFFFSWVFFLWGWGCAFVDNILSMFNLQSFCIPSVKNLRQITSILCWAHNWSTKDE